MDPTALFSKAAELGFVVLLLLFANYLLIRRMDRIENGRAARDAAIEEERKTREAEQRASCKSEITQLVADVRRLEDRGYTDQRELLLKTMDVMRLNAESFGRLVDLQNKTASGQHPIVSGK